MSIRKSLPVFVMGLIIFGFVSSVLAQGLKIGYVDTNHLKGEYKEFADAQAKFETELSAWQNKADSLQADILKLQNDLTSQSMLLSEAAKKEKEALLKKKIAEFDQFRTKILGPTGEAAKREKELSQPLVDKITKVIEKIAQRDGYTYVLDSSGGEVLFAPDSLDLTEEVLKELQPVTK
jgi:outer membrane protein